jgi:hypothetical protein
MMGENHCRSSCESTFSESFGFVNELTWTRFPPGIPRLNTIWQKSGEDNFGYKDLHLEVEY